MMVHGVEYDLWNLCPSGIIEEDEAGSAVQSWKSCANSRDGKLHCL
jgi:hypothetical protein